mmetsp:Transcript_1780/g.4389  ORF Transcript_1780/g.4389 Transcript_1780/m.4389 type:complete len:212 (+) Transcript_1780:2183-2818(+)
MTPSTLAERSTSTRDVGSWSTCACTMAVKLCGTSLPSSTPAALAVSCPPSTSCSHFSHWQMSTTWSGVPLDRLVMVAAMNLSSSWQPSVSFAISTTSVSSNSRNGTFTTPSTSCSARGASSSHPSKVSGRVVVHSRTLLYTVSDSVGRCPFRPRAMPYSVARSSSPSRCVSSRTMKSGALARASQMMSAYRCCNSPVLSSPLPRIAMMPVT